MISEYLTSFAGLPVHSDDDEETPENALAVAWRISVDYDSPEVEFETQLDQVLEHTGPGGPVALVLGQWGEAYENKVPLNLLIDRAGRMGSLRALFVGDLISEDCEISWIVQGDYTPLLAAFPQLERLWIRGGNELEIQPLRHEALLELVVQAGGTPPAFVRAVGECDLPRLESLELWLGTEDYEGGATPEDLAPVLQGKVFPKLTRLGLRNAENADEIAAAVAAAPVVGRLSELDLSLGTLGDVGVRALSAGQSLAHLDVLDLHHHFAGPDVARHLVDALPGTRVDVSDVQTEDDEEDERYRRFISVSE
ncbi:STM4015 family protein [Kineosporia sp. J2-2]|uniref:STM4015 family protein n=1 Tax=Kineosporia corallincola TaxID=2835133 RepID=A0ABS5TP83_9ACTN|nr:STM4015 family protein [Kineosporia corallincola]MBT0772810.1 STM4015 family protein [Kineosporia corallincola]